jgi:hypothetical protein
MPYINTRIALMLLALVYAVLVIGSGSTLSAAFSIPHDSASQAVAYMSKVAWKIRWGSFCELGSAIPFGVFVGTVVSRLRFLRVRAAGETIAFCGGIGAMGMVLLAALSTWSLTRPGIASADDAVRALQAISFACGGPGFVAALGLFVAGVSVTAGLHRLIPRWLMWLGIFVAVACELATLTLLVWNFAYCIPVGRFIGIAWMIGVAATLPRHLAADQDRREASATA